MKVIRFTGVLAVGFGMVLGATSALAQNVAQVGGPAEIPPASFAGQQYVDSRGCVFMRAGFAGQTNWVPRIGQDRKPICNNVTPAQAAARLAMAEDPVLANSSTTTTQTVGAPMETVASAMGSGPKAGVFAPTLVPGLANTGASFAAPRQVQPAAQAQAQAVYAPAPVAPPAAATAPGPALGCPASAPVLQQLPLSGGGTVAVCTRGDGSATGWVSPRYVNSARPGAAIRGAQGDKLGLAAPQGGAVVGSAPSARAQTVIAGKAVITAPRAAQVYTAAWKDDRLNPNRGLGTAQGWADQAQIWTNTVPAKTHADVAQVKAQRQANSVKASALRVSGSTMSAAPVQTGVRIYVQVGTFGQSANAQHAAGRLAGMGLPVASAKGSKGGKPLVSIMAGPFGSTAEAQVALNAARQAGFGDAFIR